MSDPGVAKAMKNGGAPSMVPDERALSSTSFWCGVATLALGGAVLLGWAIHVEDLKQVLPGYRTMKPNAAVSFELLGLALALRSGGTRAVRASRFLAGAAAAIGAATLLEYMTGLDFGIDQILFRDDTDAALTLFPGRITHLVALCFVLAGSALAFKRKGARAGLQQSLGALIAVLALFGFLEAAYGVRTNFGIQVYTQIALHAALGFLILGLGIVFAEPEQALARLLQSDSTGGRLARLLLPAAIVLPLVFGAIGYLGQKVGLFEASFRLPLLSISNAVLVCATVVRAAFIIDRKERARATAMQQLSDERAHAAASLRFEALAESLHESVLTADETGKINYANPAAAVAFQRPAEELIGQPLTILMPARFQEPHRQGFARYLAGGQARVLGRTIEIEAQRKDGTEFPVELSLSTWKSNGQHNFAGVIRDVSERHNLLASLRATTELLAAAERVAKYGSFEIDARTGSIKISDGFKAAFGLPPESDKNLDELVAMVIDEDRQAATDVLHGALENAGSIYFEYRLRRADGAIRNFDVTMETFAGPDGKPSSVIGIARDLTKQKEAQSALREAEDRFSKFFMQLSLPLAITRRSDAKFIEVNDAFTRTTGWSRNEVLGRTAVELGILQTQEERDRAMHELETTGQVKDSEGQIFTKGGRVVEVITSLAMIQLGGEPCIATTFFDVTDRRKSEEKLRQSEQRFATFFEASPLAVAITRVHDGQFVDVNPTFYRLLGWTREEAVGRTATDLGLFVATDQAEPQERSDEPKSVRDLAVQAKARDGRRIDLLVNVERVIFGDRDCLVASLLDVTDRNEAQHKARLAEAKQREVEQLKEIDEFRTQFINSAAHELNTPLTPIDSTIRLLRKGGDTSPEDRERAWTILTRNFDRLGGLIGDLLEAARFQAGRLEIHPSTFDAGTLVHEVTESFQASANERGILLTGEVSQRFELQADRDRVSQILYNLVSNALKFTEPGGKVKITAVRRGHRVDFQVTDTGIGMARDQLALLFKPFSRLHDRATPGTGLGLYISQGFASAHGGLITAKSPGAGQGSTFTLTMPERLTDFKKDANA